MIDLAQAILAINPDAKFMVQNDDLNRIEWFNNTTPISNEDILAKQAELQVEYDANQYQRDRTNPLGTNIYPVIGDQMDMIYHDQADGTTTFKDAIKAIKDAHPKP